MGIRSLSCREHDNDLCDFPQEEVKKKGAKVPREWQKLASAEVLLVSPGVFHVCWGMTCGHCCGVGVGRALIQLELGPSNPIK